MIKDLFKDILKYSPSKIIPAIVGIIALPVITRFFSPADYGNYILVIATVSILSICTGWVSMSVLRFYPTYEKDSKSDEFVGLTVKLAFLSIFLITIISIFTLVLLRNHVSENLYRLMIIGIFVLISDSLFSLLLNFLRIKRQVEWYSGFYIWQSISAYAFGILLIILFGFGVEGLLWGVVLSVGFALPLLWKIAIGRLLLRGRSISWRPTFEMAKYSFPLLAGNLSAWVLSLSDRYLLQFFRGDDEVGIYSVSYHISDRSVMLFTSLFALAFNPLTVNIWEKQGKKASQLFLSKATRYFLILCIPAVVGISVLGGPIVRVLSTPNYYQGAKIIPFVASGVFFLGLNQKFGAGLSFYKKTHFFMYSLILSGLINVGLNFLFIPKYGYMAAAATTLVSYIFLVLFTIYFSRRFFIWQFPFRSLAKVTIASVIMGIAVYFIGGRSTSSDLLNVFLGVCSGVLVYSIVLFLLREFQPNEKEAMKQVLKRYLPCRLIPDDDIQNRR